MTDEQTPAAPPAPKPKKPAPKKKAKAKKPTKAKKPATRKKVKWSKARECRMDVRMSAVQKRKLVAAAKKSGRTITSLILAAVDRIGGK